MPPPRALSRSANEFAVDLFQCYLKRHGDKYINLLLCPYLIYQSLAMMLVGARGQTSQQLMQLLHIKNQPPASLQPQSTSQNQNQPQAQTQENALSVAEQQRHRDFLWLAEQLIHGNHDFVHLASFIYLDKSIKRTEDFKNILRDYYETKPKKIDLGDVNSTVQTINEDVARTTENIYNEILSKQEAEKLEKSMLSVNAVFFRGFWLSNFTEVFKAPFQRNGPKDLRPSTLLKSIASPAQPKQSSQGANRQGSKNKLPPVSPCTTLAPCDFSSSMHTISMMSKLDYLAVVSDEQLDARIIKMPFEASDLQMVVILPNDRKSNSAYLCEKMTAVKLDQVISEFRRVKPTTIKMPAALFKKGPTENFVKRVKFDTTAERVPRTVIQTRVPAKSFVQSIIDDDSNSSIEVEIDHEDPSIGKKSTKNNDKINEEESSAFSNKEQSKDNTQEKTVSDAIIQTDIETKPKTRTLACQTDESLLNRPLTMSEYEHHRNNTNCHFSESFRKPLYGIPKRKGAQPPLKIGLSLPKGRKRRVIYPHLEEESND